MSLIYQVTNFKNPQKTAIIPHVHIDLSKNNSNHAFANFKINSPKKKNFFIFPSD